jgi:hypothetical protein
MGGVSQEYVKLPPHRASSLSLKARLSILCTISVHGAPAEEERSVDHGAQSLRKRLISEYYYI